jgi:hypothetical protein
VLVLQINLIWLTIILALPARLFSINSNLIVLNAQMDKFGIEITKHAFAHLKNHMKTLMEPVFLVHNLTFGMLKH